MELELLHPEIIVYAIIASIVILLVWRKKYKFKKGVMVANTKYVKRSTYYKSLLVRYRVYNILIKAICLSVIILVAILTARINKTDKFEDEFDNRDIELCMDVSGSMNKLNREMVEVLKTLVGSLKDERFGISVFDSSPADILPLSSDHKYTIDILEQIKMAINSLYGGLSSMNHSYATDFLLGGTKSSGRGSSLIGEGLAYCATVFKKGEDRTKVIILTTDNQVYGSEIITVPEASEYCKENNIRVYAIGSSSIKKAINSSYKQGLIDVANKTGGKYYDFDEFQNDKLVNEINSLKATSMIKNIYIKKKDMPEIIFPYILLFFPVLYIIDWRVRI